MRPSFTAFNVSISPDASSVVKATSGLLYILVAGDSRPRMPRPWMLLASCLAYRPHLAHLFV